MLTAIHIISSLLVFASSGFSLINAAEERVQMPVIIAMLIAALSSIVSGLALVMSGGSITKLCILGGLMIGLAFYSSRRVIVANQIRIEL